MHQNRFRLGLRPRPRWGSYSAPPDPLAGFKRAYVLLSKAGEGGTGGREGEERRSGLLGELTALHQTP